MSFNALNSNYSGGDGGASAGRPAGSSATSQFAKQTNLVSRHIFQISSHMTQLQRLLQQIQQTRAARAGSQPEQAKDEQIRSLLDKARDLVKQTGEELKVLESLGTVTVGGDAAQFTKNKLKRDFAKVAGDFQTLQRKVADHQKAVVSTARRDVNQALVPDEAFTEVAGEQQAQQQLQRQTSPRLLDNAELEFNEALIEEREAEITNIEQGITELNEIFRDLGTMVRQQGETVDSIEDNISNVNTHTQHAARDLRKAENSQRTAYQRKLCLTMILIVIVTIVLLSILVS